MYIFNGLWLAVLGALAASNLIVAKRPDAAEVLEKLRPYQGWMGAISAIWGLIGVVQCILGIAGLGLFWLTWLANSVILAALGLLLGVGVLKTFIKAPEAQAKMDETIAKLAPKQGMLGLVGIGVGVWMIVASIVLV